MANALTHDFIYGDTCALKESEYAYTNYVRPS